MKRIASVLVAVCVVILGVISISSAQDTTFIEMNYQGYLTDDVGNPLTGSYDITLAIYDTSTGGTPLWDETHYSVAVDNGYFEVILGSVNPMQLDMLAYTEEVIYKYRWLEVKIGADPPISPRSRLTSAPYAAVATRMRGDVFTGPGYLQVGRGRYPGLTVDTDDSTLFFGSNYGELDQNGIVMKGGWQDRNVIYIGRQQGNTLRLDEHSILLGNPTIDDTEFYADSTRLVVGGTFFGRGDADMSGNVDIAGMLSIGNSIDIDGDNDKITATSGIIDFDDENLVTTGKVGIGLTNPSERLQVYDRISIGVAGTYSGNLTFYPWDGSPWYHIANPGSGIGLTISGGGSPGTIDYMTITHPGNVGIGTIYPAYKLDIQENSSSTGWGARLKNAGTGNTRLYLSADSGSVAEIVYQTGDNTKWYVGNSSGDRFCIHNGLDYLTFDQSGNLGIETSTPYTTVDINGDLAIRAGSYVAVNGNNNNIDIGQRSFVRITGPGAAFTITGIVGGVDGKMVILYNTTAQNMTIANNSASSVAQNRIYTMTGLDDVTVGTGNVTLIYDATAWKWIVTALKP